MDERPWEVGELPFEAELLTKEQGTKSQECGKETTMGCREPARGEGRRLGHGVVGRQVSHGLPAESSLLPCEQFFPFVSTDIAPDAPDGGGRFGV